MSTVVSRILTADGSVDQYDHEISLVDTTASDTTPPRTESPARGWRELARKPTKTSIRERIANRKYAKWQEDRFSKTDSVVTNDGEDNSAIEPTGRAPDEGTETETVDFADRGRKSKETKHKAEEQEIDILYENQRGSFFLGIPFYSHSSLLNFDPAPWVTKDFKDSAVNITNAQVPDPTWEWAWKRWYVDMSYDVDEEGWQYSFSFGRNFVWHGTHPWFHSFVRRRRWLRKRVKRHGHGRIGSGKAETMHVAHHLNQDYFTIHPKRNRSPDSKRPESYVSYGQVQEEEAPEEIKDIATLLRALKLATVDREKIDVVKRFTDQGGDELAYLGSHIPEIMSSLVFQNSKRQLLSFLTDTASAAQSHRDEHNAEERPEGDEERRRIDNLLAAVEAARQQISGLEYWSDRKHVLRTLDGESEAAPVISTIFDKPAPDPKVENHSADNIKGISGKAEVDIDPTHALMHTAHGDSHDGDVKGKGKEKETSRERRDDGKETSPPRLRADQLLIPDE